ncbi:hypothetical protein OHA55_36340, partial [Streptomyces sp. NBC_00102]|nr:hypothetical protein [Streptomyces sp. NBC_00102]
YTLPTTTSYKVNALAVLQNAVSNGARVDVASLMTFDYYDNAEVNMANDTRPRPQGLVNGSPPSTRQDLGSCEWSASPRCREWTTGPGDRLANATRSATGPVSKGINFLSFWALQRDNGSCPGAAADGCSGIQQNTWDFTSSARPSPVAPLRQLLADRHTGLRLGDRKRFGHQLGEDRGDGGLGAER